MTFQHPAMYIFMSLTIVLFSIPALNKFKHTIFLFLNVAFVLLVFTLPPLVRIPSFLILMIWVISHYLSLKLMLYVSRKKLVFGAWLCLNLLFFIVVKDYKWIMDFFTNERFITVWWSVIGYSFILFRQVHLSINISGGLIKNISLLDYLNYNLAFWTFLAGPIQRYDDFMEQMRTFANINVLPRDLLKGLNRVLFGLIKMAIIAPFFLQYAEITTITQTSNMFYYIVFLVSFPLHLYLNFSGYCDIVIGIGKSVGFRLPENFMSPFVARNMVDFWSRWHISLSEFFRDYLFYPIFTFGCRHFAMFSSLVFSTLFSFLIMGIWHGNNMRFAIFGLLHGLGVIASIIYKNILKKRLSKENYKRYQNNSLAKVISTFICQFYVALTFLVFRYSLSDFQQIVDTLNR